MFDIIYIAKRTFWKALDQKDSFDLNMQNANHLWMKLLMEFLRDNCFCLLPIGLPDLLPAWMTQSSPTLFPQEATFQTQCKYIAAIDTSTFVTWES